MPKKALLTLFLFTVSLFSNALQDAINRAEPYSTIELEKGRFAGGLIIDKPLSIVAKNPGEAVIDSSGKGSVIVIKSKDVTLKNLTIKGSGHRREMFDSAVKAEKADNLKIENCIIKDALYGIHVSMSNNCIIKNCKISSKNEKIPFRGDGVKMWYCNNAKIIANTFDKVRDIHLDRCNFNTIKNNNFLSSRFAVHIEFGHDNIIETNFFQYNEVGILLEETKNVKMIANKILSSKGVAAIGAVFKGSAGVVFENNILKYNAKALYIDNKPTERGYQRIIKNNIISYNLEALHFHAVISNNIITFNKIFDNLNDVVKDLTGYKNRENIIEYNYWGKYMGFDRNHDNIGDTPYVINRYLDRLWSYDPKIKFFFGSVVLALADFLCKLAPFSEPEFLLEDKKPVFYETLR